VLVDPRPARRIAGRAGYWLELLVVLVAVAQRRFGPARQHHRVGHPVAARHDGDGEEDAAMSDARDAARQPDPNQLFIADSSAHGGPGRPEAALIKLLTVLGHGVRALVARLRR
jgi:hypothetical protein